jgi:BirA family biotin operon repressor/biotin-[acetyl-CoA-carboxylase] ligase
MSYPRQLLHLLADGKWHSGEELASQLGISRTAVWKQLGQLKALLNIDCHAVRGRGYRLPIPMELLDGRSIRESLSQAAKHKLPDIHILDSIASTNSYLMEKVSESLASGLVCVAEQQTEGRGRRGRSWVSPFGHNIYFSMYLRFPLAPAELSGISLVAGLAVVRTLEQLGIVDVGLKWPNDILYKDQKLAGLLLEVAGEQSGPSNVVVGIGLNINLSPTDAESIDQPWIDLKNIQGGESISRNRIVAGLVDNLFELMGRFEKEGLMSLRGMWRQYDLYDGKSIQLQLGNRQIYGVHRGIDESGALLVETEEGIKAYHGGEVSLRLA